jgi:hypothetical protein
MPELPLDVLNVELWFVIRNKFPQRTKVLLPLERDDAFTSLNGHSARKIAVLVVV